jgi:hypothetical protein
MGQLFSSWGSGGKAGNPWADLFSLNFYGAGSNLFRNKKKPPNRYIQFAEQFASPRGGTATRWSSIQSASGMTSGSTWPATR